MDERRKFFRFKSPIDVKYTVVKNKNRGKSRTTDVSREGVGFSTATKLAREERLAMEFEIPGDNMPVFAQGLVAWIKESAEVEKEVFDVGIKLTDITHFDRGRILEYAYSQWLKIKKIGRKEPHESRPKRTKTGKKA